MSAAKLVYVQHSSHIVTFEPDLVDYFKDSVDRTKGCPKQQTEALAQESIQRLIDDHYKKKMKPLV